MNTASFIIVGAATIFGATGIYFGMQYGLNASDEYASELSVTSQEYLKLRAKAIAMGQDASKIKDNAARSKKPGEYDLSLSSGLTSPFIRPDSDKSLTDLTNENFDIVDVMNNDGEIVAEGGINPLTGNELDSDTVAAAKAGLTEAQLAALIEALMKDETLGDKPEEEEEDSEIDIEDLSEDDIYTVHDEIRHQLATEEMSDEKRAMLKSLLPKKAAKAIRAVNVILEFDTNNCIIPRNSNSLIGVMFRNESQAIRGSSLNDLDELIAMRKRCDGKLLVEHHSGAISDSDIELRESRRDEVKYYLLQRRVPAESIIISST